MSFPQELIYKITNNENNIIHKLSETDLVHILMYADKIYYENDSEPIFSDSIYDILRNRLKELNPKHKYLLKIGYKSYSSNKAVLPYWMGSMDKFKGDTTQIKNWIVNYKGPYLISEKLDGISLLILIHKNKISIFTRGNGKIGRDVSYLKELFNFEIILKKIEIKKLTNIEIGIRGEMIISKHNFEKYNTFNKNEFQKSRNMISGIVNKKDNSDLLKFKGKIDFIAFEILNPRYSISDQYKLLKELEIKTPKFQIIKEINKNILSDILIDFRNTSNYDIDGIIITNDDVYDINIEGNPKYAFAFKMLNKDEIAETKVINIEWNSSKDGYLIPRIIIEQIILNGSKINKLSGKNAKFILNNKIGIGTIIAVTLDGGVIPGVVSVISDNISPKMPLQLLNNECIWDDTHTHLKLKNIGALKEENKDILIKKITYFFNEIKTENLSVGLISKLVNNNFDSIYKILNIQKEDLLNIEGFKEKLAEKIITNIQISFKNVSLIQLMVASNCFGRGLGSKKLSLLIETDPYILISDKTEKEMKEYIISIDGFSDKLATQFIKHIEEFKLFVKEINIDLNSLIVINDKKNIDNQNNKNQDKDKDKRNTKLENKKIVFSGFRNKELEDIIKSQNGIVSDSIHKNTSILIVKNINDTSTKINKAKEFNILIVDIETFKQNYLN